MKTVKLSLLLSAIVLMVSSCKKDEPDDTIIDDTYTVPTTYDFSNATYTGQTYRISMLEELSSYMKTANTSGVVLDVQKLNDMYSNTGNPFSDSILNASGKNLKDKTYLLDQSVFESYFDSLAQASQSTTIGSNGVAGVVVSSSDASKMYLFDKNGFEYTQIIEKGLMGAVFYYQAISVYLENISSDDNVTTSAEGTDMEHHWDEAFGYFGVPIDFPTSTDGLKYWGKYCNSRDAVLNTNELLMTAFIKGRAAISNSDYTVRDEAKATIMKNWEVVCVASAISYINSAKTNITDDALRNHALSECVGFVTSLKYNANKKITDAQIQEVLDYIGINLYEVTSTNLTSAKDLLSTIYGLDSVKDAL